jgi:four helix bundle protein
VALASRFEDLRAWQAARVLTAHVYALLRRGELARDYALNDQLRRAAISTMNNIAEGFDSASHTEFRRFLRYASRSASEVQSCLHIAKDQRYIDEATFNSAYSEAAIVRKLCAALIRSLPRSSIRSAMPLIKEPPPPAYGSEPLPVTGHRSPVTSFLVLE